MSDRQGAGPETVDQGGERAERRDQRAAEEASPLQLGSSYLWRVIHRPAGSLPDGAVVICSPFGPEKVKAHRTLNALARQLAAAGILVARFDHRGEGDSGGDFEQYAFDERVEDVLAVVHDLQERYGVSRWGGVGLRVGAVVLARAAAIWGELTGNRPQEGPPLSLWAPVVDVGQYLRSWLRSNVLEQGVRHGVVLRDREALQAAIRNGETVVVDGFPVTSRLFEQGERLNLEDALGGCTGRVQMLELGRRTGGVPGLGAASSVGSDRSEDLAYVQVSSSFWHDFRFHRPHEPLLFQRTLRFFEEELRPHG